MRLLSICPRVTKEDNCIVLRTAWRVRVFLLGMLYRIVIINPARSNIQINSRYFWLFKKKHAFSFKNVKAVTYGYEDMSPDSFLSYGNNSFDWFTVGLKFNDDSEFRLFNLFLD